MSLLFYVPITVRPLGIPYGDLRDSAPINQSSAEACFKIWATTLEFFLFLLAPFSDLEAWEWCRNPAARCFGLGKQTTVSLSQPQTLWDTNHGAQASGLVNDPIKNDPPSYCQIGRNLTECIRTPPRSTETGFTSSPSSACKNRPTKSSETIHLPASGVAEGVPMLRGGEGLPGLSVPSSKVLRER